MTKQEKKPLLNLFVVSPWQIHLDQGCCTICDRPIAFTRCFIKSSEGVTHLQCSELLVRTRRQKIQPPPFPNGGSSREG